MEVRPIDANAAIQEIKDIYCKECNNYNGVRCRACDFDDSMSVIDDAPTLDYAPVRRGEWIECACDDPYRHTCNMRYRCSECGRFALDQEPYCHCGARMKEDGKDENTV